jgi:hypothetical protein
MLTLKSTQVNQFNSEAKLYLNGTKTKESKLNDKDKITFPDSTKKILISIIKEKSRSRSPPKHIKSEVIWHNANFEDKKKDKFLRLLGAKKKESNTTTDQKLSSELANKFKKIENDLLDQFNNSRK